MTCVRGGRSLFENLSFALVAGDAATVRGPNGAGKSSLLRIAAGLLEPAAGSVAATGARALLAEASALDPEIPLGRAMAFWARLDGRPRGAGEHALDTVGLAHLADVPVRLLSTGQRRRAAMARVIASDAPIWLLDEPANGLDTAAVSRLEAAIAAHRVKGGIALIATHQPIVVDRAQTIALHP